MSQRAPRPFEILESRLLLSSAVRTGQTLRVYGDAGVDNVITVGLTASRESLLVTINGAETVIASGDLKRVRIFGDAGNDRITIDDSQSRFTIQAYIFAGGGDDRVRCRNERDYVEGGDGDDRISLGGGRNFGFGGIGADVIDGGGQRDFVSGGAGADSVSGGGDRDQLQGDNGDDTILGGYTDPALNTLNEDSDGSNRSGFISADGSDLIFAGRGNDSVSGDSAKDVIFGQDGDDVIDGGSNRDAIYGMAGNDTVTGGEGDDTMWGGAGTDQLSSGGGSDDENDGEYSELDEFIDAVRPRVTDA